MIRATATVTKPPRHTVWISNNHHIKMMDRECKQESAVPARWVLAGVPRPIISLCEHKGLCNQWCYINKYFPFRHPQVCTPAFYGCRSKSTICPPGASGVSSKGVWCSIGDESPGLYVPEDDMSASKSPNVCCKFENFEHNQTRLKLNCVIRSTLYIQVEECLSESQYHHYAWGGVGFEWRGGEVVPL